MIVGLAPGVYAGAAHGFYASVAGATLGGLVGGAAGLAVGDLMDSISGNQDQKLPRYLAGGLGIAGGVAGAVAANYFEGPLSAVVLGAAGAVAGAYLALRADSHFS